MVKVTDSLIQKPLPCPFCGASPVINQRGDACGVFCNCNHTSHMQTYGGNEAEAVRRWNTRPNTSEISDNLSEKINTAITYAIRCGYHGEGIDTRFITKNVVKEIVPYLRSPVPVSVAPVSLARCIIAAAEVDKAPFAGYRSIAIAILTIAGVPYVD